MQFIVVSLTLLLLGWSSWWRRTRGRRQKRSPLPGARAVISPMPSVQTDLTSDSSNSIEFTNGEQPAPVYLAPPLTLPSHLIYGWPTGGALGHAPRTDWPSTRDEG